MLRIPTLQTTRLILAISAAAAVSACAGGSQQQVTPTSTSVLAPTSTSALAPQTVTRAASATLSERRASDDNRNVEGGDDGNGTVVYSSIPKPLHAVASIGFEATQALEFGDGVNLTHTGKLQRVRYVLSSWGCQMGHWNSGDCVTHGTPTFPVPFTVNVYAVSNTNTSRVGALLTTQTQTFAIPYRPSSDHVRCPNGETFYSTVDAACVHGLANIIVFDFGGPRVSLPGANHRQPVVQHEPLRSAPDRSVGAVLHVVGRLRLRLAERQRRRRRRPDRQSGRSELGLRQLHASC